MHLTIFIDSSVSYSKALGEFQFKWNDEIIYLTGSMQMYNMWYALCLAYSNFYIQQVNISCPKFTSITLFLKLTPNKHVCRGDICGCSYPHDP